MVVRAIAVVLGFDRRYSIGTHAALIGELNVLTRYPRPPIHRYRPHVDLSEHGYDHILLTGLCEGWTSDRDREQGDQGLEGSHDRSEQQVLYNEGDRTRRVPEQRIPSYALQIPE